MAASNNGSSCDKCLYLCQYIYDNNGWNQVTQDSILGVGTWPYRERSQHHIYECLPARLLHGRHGRDHARWSSILREKFHQLGPGRREDARRGTGTTTRYVAIRLRGTVIPITRLKNDSKVTFRCARPCFLIRKRRTFYTLASSLICWFWTERTRNAPLALFITTMRRLCTSTL